jgi:hypothetical protein
MDEQGLGKPSMLHSACLRRGLAATLGLAAARAALVVRHAG